MVISSQTIKVGEYEDDCPYGPMPEVNVLPWQFFTTDFLGKDKAIDNECNEIIQKFP